MGNVGGYIKLHRQLLNWEWWDNANMTRIWIYFLLKANYQDSTWHGITIPRGSFITSLDAICKDTGLSVREIRTCLNRLKSTGELTIKTTNRYTMVTISKYDVYNSFEDKSDKQNDTPQDNQETNKRQTRDKQTTTDNNNKEYKETKEEIIKENTNVSKKKDFSLDKAREEFKSSIKPYVDKYGNEMCNDFFEYWTEPTQNGKKMRYQLERTWEIGRRLARWNHNKKQS